MTSVLMGRIPLRAILIPAAAGQDLLASLLHPDAAAAGALRNNDRGSANLLFYNTHGPA